MIKTICDCCGEEINTNKGYVEMSFSGGAIDFVQFLGKREEKHEYHLHNDCFIRVKNNLKEFFTKVQKEKKDIFLRGPM